MVLILGRNNCLPSLHLVPAGLGHFVLLFPPSHGLRPVLRSEAISLCGSWPASLHWATRCLFSIIWFGTEGLR